MNFINLIELLKDNITLDQFQILKEDFFTAYQAEYKNIKPCKSAMEKAQKKYIANATMKDDKTATYTDGTTALFLSKYQPETENKNIKSVAIAEKLLDIMKEKKPSHCYFIDCIAMHKALKKQEKQNYYLCLDGYLYNIELVSEIIDCICTQKEKYIRADICKNGELFIQQTGAALVLPVVYKNCHVSKNVNSQDIFSYLDGIEKQILHREIKTA